MNDFAHLHLHTEFSLLDGACQIDDLVEQAARFGMKSLAITDHGNMFGAVAFHDACRAKGVKPIVGCEVYVATGSRFDKNASGISEAYNHLTLLASDLEGYHNLVRLVSIGYTEGFYHRPRIDKEVLQKYNKGIVCLSGCLSSEVGVALRNGNEAEALKCVGEFGEIFDDGRFYLEIMEHGLEEQRRVTRALTRIHERTGLPLVATNDAHYLLKDDHQAHDVLLCIGTGKKVQDEQRFRFDSQEFFVKSAEEMSRVFPDHPEALANTLRVAERCDFTLQEVSSLPAFDVPSGYTTESYFEKVTRDGFAERRKVLEPLAEAGRLRYPLAVYADRLEKEIGVIRRVGFSGYFLIVWDFIRYAREKRVPVGPGRGSAAGSLVAYCLRITDIDPIEYDLIFERFLNEERISPPDIDIDFCEARRGEVIEYVTRKYGRENVAQIITFGTMKAKAVVRDVARAMDMSFGDADKIAKMIPFDLKMTLEKALEESPPLQEAYQRDPKVKELIDISRRLEGTTRHASIHAAGVVISPQPLVELVPLFRSNTGDVTTQYDMKGVERIGLLKMDFLGLRTLTLIDNCVKMIEAQTGVARRSRPLAPGRRQDLRAVHRGEDVGPLPVRVRRHARHPEALQARGARAPDRAQRALSARADADDRRLHQASARPDPGELRAPEPRAHPEGHLRGHGVPGAGHADRLGPRRVHPGRGRHPPEGDGEEEGRRHGHPEGEVPEGLRGARGGREEGREDLGPDGAVRGLRLQQVALRGLRLARVPDGIPEGQLSRLLHGGPPHLGARHHRQDGPVHRRVPGDGHQGPPPRRQPVGHVLHGGRRHGGHARELGSDVEGR